MAVKLLPLTILLLSLFQVSVYGSEVAALLAFKSSSDHFHSLSSWSDSTNPCSGSCLGVACSNGQVTQIVLEGLNLTGPIRALAPLSQLRVLSLNHNRLSSAVDASSWPNLKHLYLSHNRFAGEFPTGVSSLRRIRRLVLSHNNFSGEIPMTQLTQLPHLLTLRLEENSFSGALSSNSSFSSISDFNVSRNNLAGEIPTWLSPFPASSFAGNPRLCGKPLPYGCSNQTAERGGPIETSKKKKRWGDAVAVAITSIDVVAVVGIIVTVGWCYYRRKNVVQWEMEASGWQVKEREEMVMFEGCKGFSKVDDLLKSSAEMLGKGFVGNTYKVVIGGGDGDVVVVVKRVRERRKMKELDELMKEIGGLRHLNIVSLLAYYTSREEFLLVYDFLPSGSLHYLLHGNRGPGRTPLDWTTRLKLASGSARGLAFLHGYKKSKLFHGHLTSSNIIVDRAGNACIADIGLHHFLRSQSSSSNDAYRPPELAHTKLSQKTDVYSFGAVLLEILTGKMATGEGEMSFLGWVQHLPEEDWTWEVFDFELWRYKEMMGEMKALLQVALLCLAPVASNRPKMRDVVKMIEDIRRKDGQKDGANSPIHELSSGYSSQSESTPNFTSSS